VIQVFCSRQFVLFLVTGGTAAVVNFGTRILYDRWMDYSSSIIVAYLTGMITAFVLARLFVFTETRHGISRSAVLFTLVNLVAVVQTWVISMGLAFYVLPLLGFVYFVPEIAHAIGVAAPILTSYLGHKHLSFR
jgi:putative flippase GtrA